jgi:hypothetical protein
MKKERMVYLLGAGAAMDWCGPSTQKLTENLLIIGFKNKNGEFITKKIFNRLLNGGEPDFSKVNFETIINVLEDFVEFWSRDKKDHLNGLSFFVEENHINWKEFVGSWEIQNKYQHSYSLNIQGASEAVNSRLDNIPNEIKAEKKFFEALIIEILDSIVGEISRYSYHTKTKTQIFADNNKEINDLAESFFSKHKNKIQRIYTLNYDSIIENIFKRSGISFSDGFQKILPGVPQNLRHLTPSKIYRDFEENKNCIYHLHGSAFWEVIDKDSNEMDYYNFIACDYLQFPFNGSRVAEIELEKGRPIQIQNIITGYKKVIKTGLSPFRQFFSVFDRDCYLACRLIVVGYSFGDEHINDIINKARSANEILKIEIIDPSFDFNSFSMNHLRKWYWIDETHTPEQLDEETTFYKQANLYVYKCFFKKYLEKKSLEK